MNAKMIFVHALTPLHPGTGRGIGVIDLPIAREVATNLPYLPGSSLKGVLRDVCGDNGIGKQLFGPKTQDIAENNLHAGAAQFTDQRLLLLPVRSLVGTFAWVTSPYVLHRFIRDYKNISSEKCPTVPRIGNKENVVTSQAPELLMPDGSLILEDLKLKKDGGQNADAWGELFGKHLFPDDVAWKDMLKSHLCIVHDDIFNFLLETGTEVIARIRLEDDTKTVTKGGLWYEEALPTETILSGLVVAQQIGENGLTPNKVLQEVTKLVKTPVQLGGSATIGRGLCRLQVC